MIDISKALGKKHPTIIIQLSKLEEKRYILRDEQRKYDLNKEELVKYWGKKYKLSKEYQKIAIEKFEVLLNLPLFFRFISSQLRQSTSIDDMGKNIKDAILLNRHPEKMDKLMKMLKSMKVKTKTEGRTVEAKITAKMPK